MNPAERAPRFSVVMPAFNASASIARAIASVRAQIETDWELIIVDDCSTDDTAERARAAMEAHADDRLEIVLQPQNRGVAAARNAGLDRARGMYVTFIDSDDEYLPGHLATLAAEFSAEVDVVVGGREVVRTDGSVSPAASRRTGTFAGEVAVRLAMLDRLSPFPWDKAFRRSLFETVRFPDGAARFEDMMTNLVLYSNARRVTSITIPTYRYYVAGTSLTWGRVPTLRDTEAAFAYLDVNLRPDLKQGSYTGPYRTMCTLVSLLVAQSALVRGDAAEPVRASVRACRAAITPRHIWSTLRNEPRLGIAALLLKVAPGQYGRLYRRHVARSFGISG